MKRHTVARKNIKTIRGLVLSFGLINAAHAMAQAPSPPRTPKEVLQAYRLIDAEGGRLSTSGWYKSSEFFVKPSQAPRQYVLEVIRDEKMWDSPISAGEENKVRIDVDCSALGQIDSLGRFTSMVGPSLIDSLGRPVSRPKPPFLNGPAPMAVIYYLVLTDSYWGFGPDRHGLRQVKGPLEWRIESFQYEPMVRIDAAIRYLTEVGDQSHSEVTKKNAQKSIAALRLLR